MPLNPKNNMMFHPAILETLPSTRCTAARGPVEAVDVLAEHLLAFAQGLLLHARLLVELEDLRALHVQGP